MLAAVDQAFRRRVPLAMATVLEGPHIGRRAFVEQEPEPSTDLPAQAPIHVDPLQQLASRAAASRTSIDSQIAIGEASPRAWAHYRPARPGLWIFGAGDDARTLLRFAKELGWFVSVADGRAHLATRERFPSADALHILPINHWPDAGEGPLPAAFEHLHPEDAAVVMTHSFEQDSKTLACLLGLHTQPVYIGVLGPQRRTRELLVEAASLRGVPSGSAQAQVERWLLQLHAPTGLDLGAESPESIALSIVAEIQKVRTSSTALPLRTVRADAGTIAGSFP
jgi:xanthine/CO dehydrogenase XdhC/CoxF family maturation factor